MLHSRLRVAAGCMWPGLWPVVACSQRAWKRTGFGGSLTLRILLASSQRERRRPAFECRGERFQPFSTHGCRRLHRFPSCEASKGGFIVLQWWLILVIAVELLCLIMISGFASKTLHLQPAFPLILNQLMFFHQNKSTSST